MNKHRKIIASSNQKNRRKKYKISLLTILVVISFAAIYAYKEYNRGLPDTRQRKTLFEIDAREFLKQFEDNEPEAAARYIDKTISVRGTVAYTNVTDTSATVYLNGSSAASVICEFQKDSYTEPQKLKEGDLVTIKGICSGYLMDVVMVRCVVDEK